ncbi:MAG: hypothetical protein PHH59_02055 [Methylovulum sp.]|uniref:hypothetical protein n=1 Tax=Methylovulum sp. TaxID=1916980 RepID=UPI002614DFAD|nr:hypothetical protein [Methylovulum sp.]MDD2722794.1 hypothetical protein [Methylovulum sp.]MDD5124914.1 hypothetical protein [Methylovulum sp.]
MWSRKPPVPDTVISTFNYTTLTANVENLAWQGTVETTCCWVKTVRLRRCEQLQHGIGFIR